MKNRDAFFSVTSGDNIKHDKYETKDNYVPHKEPQLTAFKGEVKYTYESKRIVASTPQSRKNDRIYELNEKLQKLTF